MTRFEWNLPYPSRRMPVLARNVVATSQPLAAQAGLRMLQQGGNAADAALATAISLTVLEPCSNGIGSDAFAQIWDGETLHGINGSGRSPRAFSRDRFDGLTEMPALGWDTVTVPGAVDLWRRVSERFGRLPFAALFGPAIHYAESGYPVSPVIARSWEEAEDTYRGMTEFEKTFFPGGRAPRPGERFACPDMARTLTEIAQTGGASFYTGELARRIAGHARETGGAMTLYDLAEHTGEWVTPIGLDYHGVRLHELPPNGQGMTALMALGILSHFDIRNDPVDSADAIHLQVEAMKAAFAAAYACIGDPAFMQINYQALIDPAFLDELSRPIRRDRAATPGPAPRPDQGTVYLAAADAGGMMVSLIQSNYAGFGSGIVIPGTGISLHNRGRGFRLEPGHPNCVAGGKRPFHTIIPGFVTRNGRPLMSFGVMGAPMQPQGHVQMMVRIFDNGQNPQAAADAPRWYVWEDGSVSLEPGFREDVRRGLTDRGHRVLDHSPPFGFGGAQLVYRLADGYLAASDPRKDGQAVGY